MTGFGTRNQTPVSFARYVNCSFKRLPLTFNKYLVKKMFPTSVVALSSEVVLTWQNSFRLLSLQRYSFAYVHAVYSVLYWPFTSG